LGFELAKAEVVDLTVICRNFPERPPSEVVRENLLFTIDRMFESGVDVVIIEGEESIGKTTLLAQYARRYPDEALSIFIKPMSRYFYDPEFIRPILCEQVHWALYREALTKELIDKSFLNTHLPRLQKRAINRQKNFYFIVDGLHHIPVEDNSAHEIILREMLPLGLPRFRFLLSGDAKNIGKYLHRTVSLKPFLLTTFSLGESEKYLESLSLKRIEAEELHKMCRGIPGNLSSVRRIIESGVNVQTIFNADPENLPDFISIEWRKYAELNQKFKDLLAVIAYGRSFLSINDLVRITTIDSVQIEEFIHKCSILAIDPKTNQIGFISEPHRKFVSHQLRDLKEEATNMLIDDLLKDAQSDLALKYLPIYYDQAGRSRDLLNYLTPDIISKLLDRSQSLSTVQHITDLGLNTARALDSEDALVRFSMHKSVINEITGADIWASEIEAMMALKYGESALAIAQNASSEEERFHLLALIAKIQCKNGKLPDQSIMEQIQRLYQQIDPKSLGDRAIEIASILIWSDPSLAIQMVDAATDVKDKKETDWAFSRLSIEARVARKEQVHLPGAVEKTLQRISDPKLQEFTAALAVFFGDCTAEEVIELVDKVDSRYRLLLLRHWAISNEKRMDAADVIDYALNLLIMDTTYTPKTRDFREIAYPLPSVAATDVSRSKELVGRFDSQKSSVENLGTTEDYVGLQLLLAETESKYDFDSAYNRVLEAYWYIAGLEELSIKTDCLALMVTYLPRIDPEDKIESREGLQKLLQEEQEQYINQLLCMTGDHYLTSRNTIRALGKNKPAAALDLAGNLNTQDRRDRAFDDVVNVIIEFPINMDNLPYLTQAVNSIIDQEYRGLVIDKIVRRLESYTDNVQPLIKAILPLIESIKDIGNAYLRCKASCFAYSLLARSKNDEFSTLATRLLELMKSSWVSIDVVWNRVDAGFRIVEKLAENFPDASKAFLEETEKLRRSINIHAEEYALTYLACLRLAIRSYGGLLPKHLNTKDDIDRLTELIDRIPSHGERAGLFAELAFQCYLNNDLASCQGIVANHVKPLLDSISKDDPDYKTSVLTAAIPSLYRANRITALEMISNLPEYKRDLVYIQICDSILRKTPLSDPYDFTMHDSYLISYDDAVEICDLIEHFSTDANIYIYIELLIDSLLSKVNRIRFTTQQKIDIANRLQNIVDRKLPDQNNIKHDGYKIITRAQIGRLMQEKAPFWDRLLKESRNIPNTADKALVLYTVADSFPTKMHSKRDEIIDESIEIINSIPVILEKVDHYQALAERIASFNMNKARHFLQSAMELSVKSSDTDDVVYPKQRRIIDLAYKIDPSFADQLASVVDNDPARVLAQVELRQHLKTLKLKEKMLATSQDAIDSKSHISLYPQAAWMNLAALNSGKISTFHFSQLVPYIQDAATLPISEAYPILAWIIENTTRRMSNTPQARSSIIPIFNTTLQGAELAARLTTRFTHRLDLIKKDAIRRSGISKSVIIKARERDKAIKLLSQWFEDEVQDYLKICDPYFSHEDLDILRLLYFVKPNCEVYVLTSRKHQDKGIQNLEDHYRSYWRSHFPGIKLPKIEIIVVGTQSSGDSPIHERWLLTNETGLRIGTSYNSLGITKTSEISFLTQDEAAQRELEADKYLKREKQEYNNERIDYLLFTL